MSNGKELESMVRPLSKEEQKALKSEERRKKGDEYKYLILLSGEYKDSDGEVYKDWGIVKGRQKAYDYIKDILLAQDDLDTDVIIDVSESFIIAQPPVITESTPRITFENMLSVYQFMRRMLIDGLVVDESNFVIEDYYDGE